MQARPPVLAAAICSCAVLMLTGCGELPSESITHPLPHLGNLAVATVLPVGTLQSVPLPVGYSSPTAILGDSADTRVWFWAQSETDIAAFRYDLVTNAMTAYHLADPSADHVDLGIDAPLAEDTAGHIWFGTGSTLIGLDPASGVVQIENVPLQREAAGVTGSPLELASVQPIIGLSADRAGHVAIARMGAASVPIFDSVAHTFASVALASAAGEVTGVAYLPDGTLGIATRVPGSLDGTVQIGVGAASRSVNALASFLTVDGTTLLTGDDTMLRVTEAGTASTVAGFPVPDERVGIDGVAPGPGGRIALPGRSGVIVVNAATGSSVEAVLPREACGGASLPYVPGHPVPTDDTNATCQPGARAVATDAQGDVWFVSTGSTRAIWLLPAGRF